MSFLKGKKTFLIAGGIVVYTLVQCLTGAMSWDEGAYFILGGGALATLRDGLNSVGIQLPMPEKTQDETEDDL